MLTNVSTRAETGDAELKLARLRPGSDLLVSDESSWIQSGCDLITQQIINSLTLDVIMAAAAEVCELIGRC